MQRNKVTVNLILNCEFNCGGFVPGRFRQLFEINPTTGIGRLTPIATQHDYAVVGPRKWNDIMSGGAECFRGAKYDSFSSGSKRWTQRNSNRYRRH